MTFDETLKKLNDMDFSGGQTCFVCDRNNPKNYMEVSAALETHEDRKFVNTEFKVFNQGIQQKCDLFPHGKFTHYTKADGTNSTEHGAEYWEKMKQQMKEKGGFSDDMLIFSDLQSYRNFAETGQLEQENTEVTNETEPTLSSPEAEQLFETFRVAETQTNIKIAKQQDIIDTLNVKIKQTETSQNRRNQTVAACQAVLESNAYPKLNSLISAFSESTQKSAEKKNNKIKSLKKKIKKAQKKMKQLERKQQRNKLLKGFISSLFDKNADKSAYVIGMQALKEDSLMRAEKKLEKVEQKLEKARAAFENGGLNHEDTLLLKSRIKKLEGLKTDLETKINNLTELDQSLNKLAKTEILENQLAEIQNVTRQNISGSTTISQAVDNMTNPEITTAVKKAVTGDVKKTSESAVPVKEDKNNAEQKPTEEQKNPVPIEKADLRKRAGISEKECQAIVDAGVRIQVKKADDNTVTIVFHKNDTDTVNKAIESTKTQAMKR